jgi:hypothetical protein
MYPSLYFWRKSILIRVILKKEDIRNKNKIKLYYKMPTKTASRQSRRKSMRRTVNRTKRTILEQAEAKVCCRCELRIKTNEKALGGSYDGVVCLKHRSCVACWFDENFIRGARKYESNKTKNIGLVDKPFKRTKPLCPGCKKGLPPFELIKQYYEKDNTIIITDSE